MAVLDRLHPDGPELEPFLYATVGEDRNGSRVTVLSALARLGLDPWNEAAELAALGRDAARTRLGLLLARFFDVPALRADHGAVARELTQLLPEKMSRSGAAATTGGPAKNSGVLWAGLAVLMVLGQALFAYVMGPDD